jgi:hypothetical protein
MIKIDQIQRFEANASGILRITTPQDDRVMWWIINKIRDARPILVKKAKLVRYEKKNCSAFKKYPTPLAIKPTAPNP